MNNLKFYTTFIFSILAGIAISQSKTELVIEKGNDSYNAILKIEESKDIAYVIVKGYNFNKVPNQNFEYKYSYKDLFKKKTEKINVHELNINTDYIYYSITIEKTDGKVEYLANKRLSMSDQSAALNH